MDTSKSQFGSLFIDFKCPHRVEVKWFKPEKGYGFVRLNGYPKDIFIHSSVISRAKITDLKANDILLVMIGPGRTDGQKMVVDIISRKICDDEYESGFDPNSCTNQRVSGDKFSSNLDALDEAYCA